MPKINILKTDRPVCEHCGKKINADTYCEITTATDKKIKMHRDCTVDFAVEILIEAIKDEKLLHYTCNKVDEVVKYLGEEVTKIEGLLDNIKETPKATPYKGVYEGGEYEYYDCFNIVSPNGCKTCSDYSYNTKEDRHECSKAHCSLRDEEGKP